MMRIAALEQQRTLRDLAGLSRLCDDIVWHEATALSQVADPAIIVGLWLSEEPGQAMKFIAARSKAGFTTIIVPRFKAGDLRAVIKAPSAVKLKLGEYDAFQWDDDSGVEVPGQTVIETTLHAGQWGAIAGLGVTVLAYRPHEGAGWIVLCTAGVTSRRFNVNVEAQRLLISRIIERTSESAPSLPNLVPTESLRVAGSFEELLAGGDANAPVVMLAVTLAEGRRELSVVANTLKRMGFDRSNEAIEKILLRMPDQSIDELANALRKYGWSAYLRRGRTALAEGGFNER